MGNDVALSTASDEIFHTGSNTKILVCLHTILIVGDYHNAVAVLCRRTILSEAILSLLWIRNDAIDVTTTQRSLTTNGSTTS
jgi:hypothetical protein